MKNKKKLKRTQQLNDLKNMGFDERKSEEALNLNENDLERAVEWLIQNNITEINDDKGEEEEEEEIEEEGEECKKMQESIKILEDMGFSNEDAIKALQNNSDSISAAIDWLFSKQEEKS